MLGIFAGFFGALILILYSPVSGYNAPNIPLGNLLFVLNSSTYGLYLIFVKPLVEKYNISREAQDKFALWSQQKATAAQKSGRFAEEIVDVVIPQRKKDPIIFANDEFIKPTTTLEILGKLRGAFKKEGGSVTAGNASGLNDGAAATILMSRDEAEHRDLEPLAKVVSWATCGVEPSLMGLGPIMAVNIALEKAGWKIEDGKLKKNGKPFTIEFLLVQPAFERIVAPYIKNLAKLGIDAKIRTIDPTQYQNRVTNYDYDAIVTGFGQSLSPGNEQRNYWSASAASQPGGRNYIGIENPAVDALVETLIFAKSREALITATRALDRVLISNHYVMPQWHSPHERLAYWQGLKRPDPMPKHGLGFPTLWWKEAR